MKTIALLLLFIVALLAFAVAVEGHPTVRQPPMCAAV